MQTFVIALFVVIVCFAQTKTGGRITGEQGKTILAEIPKDAERAELIKNNKKIRDAVVLGLGDKKYALVPVALGDKVGSYNLVIYGPDIEKIDLLVSGGKYKTSKGIIWDRTPLKKELAERVAKEKKAIAEAYENSIDRPLWDDGFGFPLKNCCDASSPFGETRIGAKRGAVRRHYGLDLRARDGDEIFAIADGMVVFTASNFLEGNFTIIDHGANVFSLYMHQSEIKVAVGEFLKKGRLIGLVGKTGSGISGPHLHIEIKVAGVSISPLDFIDLVQKLTPDKIGG